MKALFFDGSSLRLREDYPKPPLKGDEVIIKVLCTGICRTDIEIVRGYMNFTGIPGHEFVGLVEEGRGEGKNLLGKRVVGEINCSCGRCEYCRSGLKNHCPHRTVLGIWKRDGTMAEYVSLPAENVHILPEEISDEEAVFVEPVAACMRVLEQVEFSDETSALVIGDGKMGILAGAVLRAFAGNVMLVGKHRWKVALARKMGIEAVLLDNFSTSARWDVVVEASGSPDALTMALQCVKPAGKVVLKTTSSKEWNLNLSPLVVNEITLIGSRCGPFDRAIEFLRKGEIDASSLISHRFPLDEAVKAFQIASSPDALKVLLYP